MATHRHEARDEPNVDFPSVARPRRRRTTTLRRLAIIIASTFLGVCVLVTLLQSRLIYFPSRGYERTPKDVGLDFERLELRTQDGLSLAAWYVPCADAVGTVLFCHGNAGNMADRLLSIDQFHAMGLNVLIFDYRGYGDSEGKPNERGTYLDAEAAWRHLIESRGTRPERVVLFGRSLGGAVAIDLAMRYPPGALVVESTFTSLVDIGKEHYPLLPVSLLLSYRYESIDKIGAVTCPKLFFHGRDDTLVPFENGRRLFEAAAEPKQFIETPGGHNDGGFTYSPEYAAQLRAYVHRALADTPH